jgi:hypothetical protein
MQKSAVWVAQTEFAKSQTDFEKNLQFEELKLKRKKSAVWVAQKEFSKFYYNTNKTMLSVYHGTIYS